MTADDAAARPRPEPGTVEVELLAPQVVMISLRGECDISTAPQLAEALARTRNSTDTLINLSACEFIDSTIIRLLSTAQHSGDARRGRLAVVTPSMESSVVRRVFDLMRLRDVFSVYETMEAAQKALGEQPEGGTV